MVVHCGATIAEPMEVAGRRLGGTLGTMAEFWTWAFADLKANNLRGVFAEWMVAQLLGLRPPPRANWAEYDLALPDGRTIEVKASAFLQVWHAPGDKPSTITFSGLKGRSLDAAGLSYAQEATYNADMYIFCVQTETDPVRWDALDLAQWRFHVVPRAALEVDGTATMRLSTVVRLAPPLEAGQLARAVLAHDGRAELPAWEPAKA